MTAPNKFSIDVVAKDLSASTLNKVNSSVAALKVNLESTAAAYERVLQAQQKMGVQRGRGGQDANDKLVQQLNNLVTGQDRAAAAAKRREEAIVAAANREEQALARANQTRERSLASNVRIEAQFAAGSQRKIAAYNEEIRRSEQLVQQYQKEAIAANKRYGDARSNAGTNPDSLKAAREAASAASQQAAAVARVRQAEADLAAAVRGRATAQREASKAADQAAAAAARLAASTEHTANQMNSARYATYQMAAAYGAFSKAAFGAFTSVAQSAITYEAAFAQVARTTDLGILGRGIGDDAAKARAELANIQDDLLKMSTNIPVAFTDLSVIASLGAQLGIGAESVANFTEVVAKFTAQTNVSAEQSATYFGRLQNILDVPTSQFSNLGSAVSQLGTDSVATESEILAVTTQIGAMANNAGFSAEYVVGLSTALASLRVPPELARGTTTRVFQLISRAASEGAEGMEKWGRVMGLSGQAAEELWKSNPEQFFSRFIGGLSSANDAGQSLIPMLDSLGIKAARDVPVITRLANSYDLLGKYVGTAYQAYAENSYLDESFETIAQTAAAAISKMQNSFSNLKANIGSTFLPMIEAGANALNKLFEVLSNLIPSGASGAVLGMLAMVAVIAAVRAAMALALGLVLAMRTAFAGLGLESAKTGALFGALRQQLALLNGVSAGTTGALTRQAAAHRAAALAAGQQASATGALGLANAGAAGTGLVGMFSKLGKFIGPGGAVLLGVGLLGGLLSGFASTADKARQETERMNQEMAAMRQSWIDAGGGADELRKAIEADTAAYEAAGGVIENTAGFFRKYVTETRETATGTESLTTVTDALGNSLGTLDPVAKKNNDTFLTFSRTISEATGAHSPLLDNLKSTSRELGTQTKIIGENTVAWMKQAKMEKFQEVFGTPELRASLEELRAAIGDEGLIELFREPDAEKVRTTVDRLAVPIHDELAQVRTELADTLIALGQLGEYGEAVGLDADQLRADADALQAREQALLGQITVLAKTRDETKGLKDTLDGLVADDFYDKLIGELVGVDEVAEDLNKVEDATKTAAEAARDASSAFDDFYESAFALTNLEGSLASAFEDLGASLVENGNQFSNFTEEGRANMAALTEVVDVYAQHFSAQVANGAMSSTEAAAAMAEAVRGIMAQLSTQDIDMTQLQFLEDYANSLVQRQWTVSVNADTSAAIANVSVFDKYLSSVVGQANAFGNVAKFFGGKTPAAMAPKKPVPVSVPKYVPSFNAGKAAAEAEKLAAEQKGAGAAGEKAGKATKDAADDAAEAIKNEADYVKELAEAFSNLTKDSFAAVDAEGAVFESLQKLGNGFLDNGLALDNMTENGRENLKNLTDALSKYGEVVAGQVQSGELDKAGGLKKMAEFASGVRSELVALGVPLQAVDGFLKQLGASTQGWVGTADDVQQFAGFIEANADALRRTAEQAKLTADYIKDLASAYKDLTSKLFQGVVDEGSVFESLQKLGIALEENGKRFNTVTEDGRKNYAALSDALGAYGDLLSSKIADGELSAADAGSKFKAFASGIYQELISLGVSAAEIQGFFRGIGIDSKGFAAGGKDVAQYTGYIRTANGEMVKLRDSTDDARQAASEYAKVMKSVFDNTFGLQTAVDGVQKAMNSLKQAYQDNIDKVAELRRENASLSADISSTKSDKRKAEIESEISKKYGETDRAAEYDSQVAEAAARIAELEAKQKANSKELSALEKGRNALNEYTDEAIANREALRGLTSEMIQQVEEYAATGKSQAEVAKYTENLKKQFVSIAQQAGYNSSQLTVYTKAFDNYVLAIKKVPATTTTKATADVSAAAKALNSIPKSGTYETTARVKANSAETTKKILDQLPKKADYTVTAKLKRDQLDKELAKLPTGRTLNTTATVNISESTRKALDGLSATKAKEIKPEINQGSYNAAKGALDALANPIAKTVRIEVKDTKGSNIGRAGAGSVSFQFAEGGVIPHFASGGRVPGPTPSNLSVDNMLGLVRGKHPVALQGGEGIVNNTAMRMPGVPEFVDQVNKGMKGYYANTPASSGRSYGGTQEIQMPTALIREIASLRAEVRNLKLTTGDGKVLADTNNRGNAVMIRNGMG